MIVNHVMSQDVHSGIFENIIDYFKRFSPPHYSHVVSVEPLPVGAADVWHYHRPHLEHGLMPNSVVTVHHDLNDTDQWLSFDKFRPRYSEARVIVCLNTTQKEILAKYGLHNTVVIPHGYNSHVFDEPRKKIVKQKYNILLASRRYGRRVKGESYLIELLPMLNNRLIRFILVGQDRSIDVAYLSKFGFEYKVYERLPYRMFKKLYDYSDFLLMTSYFEGGPANIPEALASATPIICNPIGMARDLVTDNHNGIWLNMIPRVDAESINCCLSKADWVGDVFDNSYLISKSGKAHSWEDCVAENCKVYEGLVS